MPERIRRKRNVGRVYFVVDLFFGGRMATIRMSSGDFNAADDIETEGSYPVYGGNGFRGFTERFNTNGPIVLIGTQGTHCGNVHVVNDQIWVSKHALRCIPEKEINARWLAYALQNMDLNQYSVSAAQPGLSIDNLKKPFQNSGKGF